MHIAIGVPMYGGQCLGVFASSVMDLSESLVAVGGKLTRIVLGNESLITRGRDTIAHIFLHRTDASHLLFADADLSFRAADVARMIKSDKSLICGPVAKKGIDWQAVGEAARAGRTDLAFAGAQLSIKLREGTRLSGNQPVEIEHAGGFILIRRDVFTALATKTQRQSIDTNAPPSTGPSAAAKPPIPAQLRTAAPRRGDDDFPSNRPKGSALRRGGCART